MSTPELFDQEAAWAELTKLAQKLGTITDRDIADALREALEAKAEKCREKLTYIPHHAADMETLRALFPDLPVQIASDIAPLLGESVPPASPEQIEQADSLLKQAHLAQIRNTRQEARKLLEEAVALAPGAPQVLEALGDEYFSSNRFSEAMQMYERALRAVPGSVALEKKHAQAVFQAKAAAAGLSLQLELNRSESTASGKASVILTVLIPGMGQLATGHGAKGTVFLCGWLASWIPLLVPMWGARPSSPGAAASSYSGIDHLLSLAGWGPVQNPSVLSVVLFVSALVFHVVAIFDAASRAGGSSRAAAQRPNRPVPPANLPFE